MIPGAAFTRAAARRDILGGFHPGTRVVGGLLAVVTSFALPAVPLVVWVALAGGCLALSGFGWTEQARALARWWTVAVLVVGVHTLTTTKAAPLGNPSWAGLEAGILALARVGTAAGWLALLVRTTGLDDLATGIGWWMAPLRRAGLAGDDLGLVLAVAMGTAPALLGEARRAEAVAALRRHGPGAQRSRRGPWRRIRERAAVVLPLLEALGRRAEALSLSLRGRRPVGARTGRPPLLQLAGLAAWLVLLAAGARLRSAGGGW